MRRSKNLLPTASRQFLTRNYPHPKCLLKCLPTCLSPTREGFFSSFKVPAVRVIARQLSGKNCLAAIFASRHQDASPGPLGTSYSENHTFTFEESRSLRKRQQNFSTIKVALLKFYCRGVSHENGVLDDFPLSPIPPPSKPQMLFLLSSAVSEREKQR